MAIKQLRRLKSGRNTRNGRVTRGKVYDVIEPTEGLGIRIIDDHGKFMEIYLNNLAGMPPSIDYWEVVEPEAEGCFWIKRTGTSGGLYTCGKHYYVDEEGFFLDDKGGQSKFHGEDSGFWERVSEPAAPPVTPTRIDMESSTGVEGDITINWPYDQLSASEIKAAHERIRENMLKGFTSTKFTTPTEENKTMSVKIKQATLINGADADNFDTEQLLVLIRGEEASIERLEEFTTKSKAITNLMAKHKANVTALVEILDAREDSE